MSFRQYTDHTEITVAFSTNINADKKLLYLFYNLENFEIRALIVVRKL